MKKKHIMIAAIALAAAVILVFTVFFATHVSIDGEYFPKNAPVFDLTHHDLTPEDYLSLCGQYPDTQILWSVPFQGSRYPATTQVLTIHSLTEAEVQYLDYLPALTQVDASECTDYTALLSLQQRRPDCQVLYRVSLGNAECTSLAQSFTAENPVADELLEKLPLLPRLNRLTLEGTPLPPEDLLRLREAFPAIELQFSLEIGGQFYPSDAESLDLSGLPVTAEEISETLPLMRRLQTLSLQETTLTDAELKALAAQFPDVFFLCTLDFAGLPCSTDATCLDLSRHPTTPEAVEAMLPFFPNLTKLDLSYCGIDDASMDELNRRHPHISIVWTMRIGLVTVRTDDTFFYPSSVDEERLPNNKELQKLRYCTEMVAVDVGHCEATDCNWAQYMPHLKYLILGDTPISDLTPLSGLKELIYLEAFSTEVVDYSPLLGCTALQDLNIGTTFGDPTPLQQMPWLHNLYWYGTKWNLPLHEQAMQLASQLPDTNVVLNGSRNIGGGWRQLPNYYVFRDYIGGIFYNQEDAHHLWGYYDAEKILACDKDSPWAGDVLAQIVRYRIDNGLSIPGIKNIDSEKAEILYQSLLDSHNG